MKTFNDVRDYLSSIPKINYGGCGFAALAMYRWLQKYNKEENIELVFLYSSWCDEETYHQNNKFIFNKSRTIDSCSHAAIKFNDSIIDCNNIRNYADIYDGSYKYIHHISEHFIKKSLRCRSKWNPSFDRKYVKQIEKDLNISLSLKCY